MLKNYFKWLFFMVVIFNAASCIAVEQKFTDHTGKTINLVDYKNKWKLFVYISSGCQYCRKEVAVLNGLVTKYADKLVVFGSNTEELAQAELQDFVAQLSIKFSMLQQDLSELLRVKHISVVPTIVIMKPNGNILEPMIGLRTSEELEGVLFKK